MIKFIAVAFAGLFFAFSASADPVFGVWKTQPGNEGNYAHVAVSYTHLTLPTNREV